MSDFDVWSSIKEALDGKTEEVKLYPKEGEVWNCFIGRNIGREQNGSTDSFSRPVIILTRFNKHMFLTLPLSSKQKDLSFYYNFTDHSNRGVSIILAQVKLMSIKRFNRKMYEISNEMLFDIKSKFKDLI